MMESGKNKPEWVKVRYKPSKETLEIEKFLLDRHINTVCSSAVCPNRGECFHKQAMTFLILGPYCTRNCQFCSVEKSGSEKYMDFAKDEENILSTLERFNLRYVTITSPTRDDLPDGGASIYALIISKLKEHPLLPLVEVLIPDFGGDFDALDMVLEAKPDVIAHNLETIPRLYYRVRKGADWIRSLEILKRSSAKNRSVVKTAFIVGLGETMDEILDAMIAARQAGTDIVVIGQYLRPTSSQMPVERYVTPDEFKMLEEEGIRMGFKVALANTFYRSSYRAEEAYHTTLDSGM
jgi:lipoic acid synthetase